jgi:hypothetical protein
MTRGPANPERSFGVTVGLALCALAAVLAWRSDQVLGGIAAAGGLVLLLFGIANPAALRVPSAHWWRLSRLLGHFNARVMLTLMFVFVLVPISLVWRVIGTDPLARRRARWPGWSTYPARYRDPSHYRRMF